MPAKSTKAAPKKSSAATVSKSALATNAKAVNAAAVPEPTRPTKRVRAVSVLEIDEATFKRAKGDTGVSGTTRAEVAQSEPAKPPKLDEETKKKLISLRFLLVEQNKRSMEAVMDAIAYEYIRPNSVEEMIEAVLDALKARALSGKSIRNDLAAIEHVNKKHALGDYDEVEPAGLSKAVQHVVTAISCALDHNSHSQERRPPTVAFPLPSSMTRLFEGAEGVTTGDINVSEDRCDAPKCHPETRVAVQDSILSWAGHDAVSEPGPAKNILWVTGPAGTGKTAIAGSIAETCNEQGLLAGAFFFSSFSGDARRRSKTYLVPTLAYQLVGLEYFQDVSREVELAIRQDPAIFGRRLRDQFSSLILRPLLSWRRPIAPPGPIPKVIIIDGLDECQAARLQGSGGSAAVRKDEEEQVEVLETLLRLANEPAFPFRIILFSRPEPAIRRFFSHPTTKIFPEIFLDNQYDPDSDIALFLRAKFAEIRLRHPSIPASWPPEDVIKLLVEKASGQFIYVSTVIRFVDGPSRKPQLLLKQVLDSGMQVDVKGPNPLAPLDQLYTSIMNRCPNPRLLATWITITEEYKPVSYITDLLGWKLEDVSRPAFFWKMLLSSYPGEADSLLEDVSSLLATPPRDDLKTNFHFYHRSFGEFLSSPQRCVDLYIGEEDRTSLLIARFTAILKAKAPECVLTEEEAADFYDTFCIVVVRAMLQPHIAAGALPNSEDRCDAPKCHPDTRVAVQDSIVGWAAHSTGGEADPARNIMWVTGPAGTGKTAIAGSIAETCSKRGLLAGAFFFSSFSSDVSRRLKRYLIPTLAYQLVCLPSFQDVAREVALAIRQDPAIFDKRLTDQLEALIIRPLRVWRRTPAESSEIVPQVIIIDGLDECEAGRPHNPSRGKAARNNAEEQLKQDQRRNEEAQVEILEALLHLTHACIFPFRILVFSRPDPAIRRFFSRPTTKTFSEVFLDDKYDPDSDIALFLRAKFAEIRLRHPALPTSWPSEDVIKILVESASGQFIYAATVIRFVDGPLRNPQLLLTQVLESGTYTDRNRPSPLAPLDLLYTSIMNRCPDPLLLATWIAVIQASDIDMVNDTLGYYAGSKRPAYFWRALLSSYPGEAESLLENVLSLMAIPPPDDLEADFRFYHRSFGEFLGEPLRCTNLYVDEEAKASLLQRRTVQILKITPSILDYAFAPHSHP
ncbi:hypothetical protein D9611_014481 [Ephemerocybe angulata]|uniref:Nephrocystin 3-like N-terminal domain-containing protein n=1 Tax=Ephemerocybe angulata TaxID=980116 RepID=A0A8H5C3P6_9AGAR|nr:hypothetical protein D9611_014481 [Tulosesus angulatus]